MNKRVAILSLVPTIALALAACTHADSGTASSTPASSRTASSSAATGGTTPDQTLIFVGQIGYEASGSQIPGEDARYAYAYAATCPDARLASRYGLRLQARWRYRGKTVALSAVQASFDERSGSLALPFMTVTLGPDGSAHRWATSLVEANRVTGYHTTGWVPLRSDYPAAGAAPDLRLRLWAENPRTNTLYCAAATSLTLAPGSTHGDSA